MLLPMTVALLLALGACSKTPEPRPAETTAGKADSHAQGGAAHSVEDTHGEAAEGAGVVTMDPGALEAAGIRLAVLQPSALGEQLRAPGEVIDNAYGTTLITPRVEALVVRRLARLGEEVAAGAPLVTLSSVDVSDAQADLRMAEQEWRRVSALGTEAVAGRRINEARVAVDRARAKAESYGLPGTSSGSINGQFTLTAPHAGRITEDNFVVGERIEPGRTLLRLVDESVVWVDAKLPSGAVSGIVPGSAATVVAGSQRMSGTVLRTAHRTSEATRNAAVRIEVPNVDDRLHAGDFVDVYLDTQPRTGATTALAVPTAALVQLEGDTVVFREKAQGAFEPVPVRTGEIVGDTTVIEEGLKAGETVVIEGAFALKAQMLKAQLGEGHGH
jgi:cobalt-zinc-cadmium efflux system membrane fusion protein